MSPIKEQWIEVDEQGRLVLPIGMADQYGIQPGTRILLQENSKGLHLQPPTTQLAKVYVEPTSRCNLTCRTCIRNAWKEPQGDMSAATWERVVESLKALPSRPEVFFGGFGEPLLLPDIAARVAQAKSVAGKVELITNGILLTEQRSRELIAAGLDILWVSLDGATPESYSDVRLGAVLPQVLENIKRLAIMRHETARIPEIGISFVAMRRNIADLPALIRMSQRFGISRFLVTNVLPYTQEMCKEMLYTRSLDVLNTTPSPWAPRIDLPRIDLNDASQEAILHTLRYGSNVFLNGVTLGQERGLCPFIERGSVVVGWNGAVSPCLALMHGYDTFLNDQRRTVRQCVYGNLQEQSLLSIWEAQEYATFRRRVQEFDFSPCTMCGGCEMVDNNEEDCFGNMFPTCGGCLWAQGVIRCP